MSSVRTILASLFTVLGGFCLLALTSGAGLAIYIWTITDSVSAPANASVIIEASPAQASPTRAAQTQATQSPAPQTHATLTIPANTPEIPRVNTPPKEPDNTEASSAMLTRAWAPPEMLVPPKDANEPAEKAVSPARVVSDASAPNFNRPNSVLASNDQTVTEPQAAPIPADSPARFEGGTPLPAAEMPEDSAAAAKSSTEDQATPPVKAKKTKTSRRRPAKDDTVETTISKGFDSLQRSISSMF